MCIIASSFDSIFSYFKTENKTGGSPPTLSQIIGETRLVDDCAGVAVAAGLTRCQQGEAPMAEKREARKGVMAEKREFGPHEAVAVATEIELDYQAPQVGVTGRATEFLPPEVVRKARSPEQIKAAAVLGFDYPATQVGVAGSVTVAYDPTLGTQGKNLATNLLNVAAGPYQQMQRIFGITGGAVTVIVAPLSGHNDGSGGAYHYGCDFTSGGVLYVDATFANTAANPLDLEVGLYIAELSEAFMGAQGKGWGCGSSNGEGLSRYLAQNSSPGVMPTWGITGPSWANAGFPDWVTKTEGTDRNYVSTGCAVVYLYWMRSMGYTISQIVQAGGSTLSDNYKGLTGKTTAYNDLVAAVKGLSITTDNPFA